MDVLQALAKIQAATTAARGRTGEMNLSTQVDKGRLQVVVFAKEGRKIKALPCGDWVTIDEAIRQLDALQTLDDVASALMHGVHVNYQTAQVPAPVRKPRA